MALLQDTPSAAFQAVIHKVANHDTATLRQVSKAICQRTTQHVPYIILRLSDSSSRDQLQQWCHTTQHFQHVVSIHILITGTIPAQVFEQTMQLLLERKDMITELHLLAAAAMPWAITSSSKHARVSTLQPLQHVIGQLKTLVIKGILVANMARDMRQLAASAALAEGNWQLQQLTLCVLWHQGQPSHWYQFSTAIRLLTAAVPNLQRLEICVPFLGVRAKPQCSFQKGSIIIPSDNQGTIYCFENSTNSSNGHDAAGDAAVVAAVQPDANDQEDEAAHDADEFLPSNNFELNAACKLLAAVAGLADAVLQLQHLKVLVVTGLPDIWQPQAPGVSFTTMVEMAAAAGYVPLDIERLQSVAAAAAAFVTMDDYGCWLLQHHPALKKVHISNRQTNWEMSWQRQQLEQSQNQSHGGSSCCRDGLSVHTCAACNTGKQQSAAAAAAEPVSAPRRLSEITTARFVCSKDDSDSSAVLHTAHHQITCYSRPDNSISHVPDALCQIISCDIVVYHHQADGLAEALRSMKSLKHLKIAMLPGDQDEPSYTATQAAVATFTAAATVTRLQSLEVILRGQLQAAADLLLPLTAAAGGPGSSLRKLLLDADFTLSADHASEVATAADNRDCCRTDWLRSMSLLAGVQHLEIHHCGAGRLGVTADTLPNSLEILNLRKVHIDPAFVAGDENLDKASKNVAAASYCHCPMLQALYLLGSDISCPGLVASKQLQQLHVLYSTWPGGWAAAVAAWPNVRKLHWHYDDRLCDAGDTNAPDCSNLSSSGLRSTTALSATMAGFVLSSSPPGSTVSFDVAGAAVSAAITDPAKLKVAKALHARLERDIISANGILDLIARFGNLKDLTVLDLPWLLRQPLLSLVQQMSSVQHIEFSQSIFTESRKSKWAAESKKPSSLRTFQADVISGEELKLLVLQEKPWASVTLQSQSSSVHVVAVEICPELSGLPS